jgi:hypothetical protein
MDEKYIQDLYSQLGGETKFGSFNDFKHLIQSDSSYQQDFYNSFGESTLGKFDDFKSLVSKSAAPSIEKKNSVVSGSSSADASSGSLSQETEDDGILSKIGNAALKAQAYTMLGTKKVTDAVSGIASNIWSEGFLKPVDDVLNAFKNQLNESNFFGGDIPDTDKPASDAVKNQLEQLSKKKGGDMSPIDPRAILQGIGNVSSLIINSVLPQEQKTKSITALANASSNIKDQLKDIEEYQQKVAPEGVMKIPYEITKNIAGMAPDLVLAAAMDNPAYAESAAAKWAETTTKKAVPVIEKYSPQAAKVVEKYLPKTTKLVKESVTSPFTKIMATKGAIKGMAETEEGEDPYVNSLYGALEGAAEGAYMHVLGVTAGEVSPAIAKLISKTGLNSAIATAISNPLANAGVFTTAKALRVAATQQRALTPEEMIMEAGTGVGFSLLHAGSIYKNQNEANHYYESVLSDNPINSLGRVINETKANLDISYDPNLTQDDIQAMMTARDAIKKAILREPDMQKKKTLGDEAVKLQNKIDAHNTINDIVEHRDALINLMNNNKSFGAVEKKMIIDKISAIADAYDNSTFGTRKRELNTEIMNLDAELSDLSDKFTNSKLPSERASIKAFIDAKRAKLAELNNELTELVTNKQKEDAVQKQTTNESVLLGQQPELGLQEVGKGNAKLEITPEQSQAIADEKDAFQEILDNPDNHDETDVQEAQDYFADPVKYYEGKIKFYEEEPNPTEDDKASLDFFKKMLEAHKAAEVKPKGTTIQAGSSATVSESTPEVTATPAPAKGTTVTIGAGGATATTSGGPTEVTTGGEGTETATGGATIKILGKDYTELFNRAAVPFEYLKELYKNPTGDRLTGIYRDNFIRSLNNAIEFWSKERDKQGEKIKSSESDFGFRKKFLSKYSDRVDQLTELKKQIQEDLLRPSDVEISTPIEIKAGEGFGVSEGKPTEVTSAEGTETKTGGVEMSERDIQNQEEMMLDKLNDELIAAKRAMGRSDNTEEAIREYNEKKKEKEDYEASIEKRKQLIESKRNVITLIEDETYNYENSSRYEFKDLYEKDPRLAALENAKDMVAFAESGDFEKELIQSQKYSAEEAKKRISDSVKRNKRDILDLENDLKENPPKEKTKKEKTTKTPSTTVTVGAGGATVSEGKPTNVTMAEGRETKTGVMDDIDLLVPKYKEYVDRDLQKAKDKYRINKSEANKKALDKAKTEAEAYKKDVADSKEKALEILTESSEYKNADPIQQDAMVKEVVRKFGERVKKAPSAETILGIEPPKVVTMTEKAALKEQIKAFGRGVKEGLKTAKDLMEKRKVFAAAIKQIEKSGAISTKKVDALLNKISKVNLEDDAAVEKVIEYAEKLFEDAEYDNKLNDANGVRAAIKALASNKKKNADLSVFAKQFLKIRPSDVENIDEYNEMAKKLRDSLEGSKITKDKNNPIKIADMIDIAKMGEYVDKMLEAQYKIDKDKLIKSARGIMGDDATFLSDDEVLELIKTGQVEGNTKVDDSFLKKITERVNKIFDSSAAMVDEMLRTGKDPLTGEDIDLSENRKKIAERFMSMDMKDLSDKEKLGVIDALNNFIRNGSVANMETVYADYKAKDSLAKAIENNVVAKKLKLFFSKKTGRAFGQQISTLPNLTEQMFRGVAASEEFKRLSGITELVNKKASVQRTMNVLTDSFIKQFYNQKANGKAFDTADNVAERGIIAAMKRDIPGTPEQQKAEFKRKKELVEKSIELLRDGTEQERKMADVYQKSYDKVLKDSNTVDEVLKKSDDKNIEAVDWWIDKWSDIYDQLADVSESIYNKKLDRDLNYTNFKFSLLSGGQKVPELSSRESVFLNSNNDIFGKGVYKKKTGVLEKSTRPEADGMEDRYFDLSFDRNMINAYQDALMDINTAGTVRQIESFFSSKAIKKIIPNKEDRDLLFRNSGKEGVIPDLIRTTRQRQVVVTDELTSVFRKLSNLGTAGAATALAGVTQPVKQTIPVAINTIINAGKMPDFFYFRNKDKVNFINNSQRGIAIRGGKSRVSVDSINKLAEAAATSKASKVIELLGKANEIALKAFVEKPDVWIAKASWITYYEKGLKKQGIDPSKFDYAKDKINEEAADYAQDMVDRQQNISDADLQGKLMNTKDPIKNVMVKTVMPFASFRMNQTMRMYSDLKSLFSKKGNATKEDRITAFKSLAGYGAEMATFKYTQYLIASYIGGLAVQAMGINETDDDKKKREEMLNKSQTTGTVTDVLSPLPMLDVPVAIGADKALSYFQDLEDIDEEDKFNLMTSFKQNGAKSLGLYGIAVDKANSIIDAFEIATTGKYTDEYGREKYVSRKTADALGNVALMATGSSLIGFPAEMNAVLRNSLRLAKKNSSTKQGGKEAYTREVESKRADVLKKKEDKMKIEVEALNRMLEEETEPDKRKEIKLKIREAKEAPYKGKDQKEEEKMTRREEKEKLEEMLQGYDSKSDMKRYDPDLYEKTFGEGSDYYEKNNTEKEVKSDLTKEKKIIEDEEYDYSKRKKRKKNRDGTYKKSYYKSYFKRY